jgi:dTDP-4-amino-4,6-dideoxygalactose transaminase
MTMPSESLDRPAFLGGKPIFDIRFRFIEPTLPPLETVLKLYQPAYSTGMITNCGLVSRFEREAAERLAVKHCVAVSSCTSGLMLTMKVLGVTGEVILPGFTFFASGHAVMWNGIRPVFADCDPGSWNIDPVDVERRITGRTSAILAVHLYGNPCDVQGLERVARRAGVKLIFDAAHAFGSEYGGRPIGQFGDAEVFSLTPTKLLVAGEGGLIATNDAVLARLLRAGRNYGDAGAYDPEVMGLNARMTEFNAATALAGLPLVDGKVRRHNEIAARYIRALSALPGIRFQQVRGGDICSYKDFSMVLDPQEFGMTRDDLRQALLAENIETKKYFYPPMHRQKLYRRYHDSAHPLPHTDRVSDNVLSLPIYDALPDRTCEGIIRAIERIAAVRSVVQQRATAAHTSSTG